jgi:hypothetical protein
LITTVQPAASAGATLRVIIAAGKFQGVIAASPPLRLPQHKQVLVRMGSSNGFALTLHMAKSVGFLSG